MTRQLTLTGLFIILLQLFLPGLTTESENFILASKVHQEMCAPPHDPGGDSVNTVDRCCGFCSNNSDCNVYGSCCLRMYETFEEANLAVESTRYECVLPQLITSRESTMYPRAPDIEPVWMITKCDPNFRRFLFRYGVMELCENPELHDSLETILPFETVDGLDYRNIFCAYCNGVDMAKFRHWRVKIHCNQLVAVTDEDLVNSIRNKRCNIFYIPPWHKKARPCSIPQYRINQCNETGLWQVYNDTLIRACESFVDPFNYTYRNFFCYLCNSREIIPRGNWYCPAPLQETQNSSQDYTTTLYTIDVLTQKANKETVCDLDTQFMDYKMKICRDKLCHPERYMNPARNKCELESSLDLHRPCVSVFIKMNALKGNLSPEYEFTEKSEVRSFLGDVWDTFLHNGVPERVIVTIDIYVGSNRNGKGSSKDYYVLKLILYLDANRVDTGDIVQQFLLYIHQKTLRLKYRQTLFFFELETYKEVFQGTDKRFIHVPEPNHEEPVEMEWLGSRAFMREFTYCLDTEAIIAMHKIQVCPYIQIRTDELSMNFKKEFLILNTYNFTSTFSQFEYELQNDTINICLSDFLPFFYAMTKPTEVSSGQPVYIYKVLLQIISFTMCLKVSRLLY